MSRPSLTSLLACIAIFAQPAAAASYVFAGDSDGPDIVAHPKGYVGAGGAMTITVCADATDVPVGVGIDAFASSVELAVDALNAVQPSDENIGLGANNELAPTKVDLRSAVLHELGHCLGLAHPNGGSEAGLSGGPADSTRAIPGANLVLNVASGVDGIHGSDDDPRSDDIGLYWYVSSTNFPLGLPLIVDQTTLQRTGALPLGHSFAANADRDVLADLGIADTESVMQELQFFDEVQRRVTAEDLRGLRFARSGLDRIQGTADDYTVALDFTGVGSSCDIPVRFNPASEFAQCELVAAFITGNAIGITDARILLSPNIDWYASVGPNITVTPTATPNPGAPGQPVTVQIAVTKRFPTGPDGEASGGIEVDDGAGAQCVAVANNSNASCVLTPLVRGTRPITARFAGMGGFDASTGTVSHQTTGPAVTAFASATDTPGTTVVGQAYLVSATISSPLGPPDGSLTFTDDLGANCSNPLAASGATTASAGCNLPSNDVGTRTIQASYAGNAEFAAAQTTIDHIVNKASTTTSIVSHMPDPNALGVPVAVTIGLSVSQPGAGTPSGTVRVSASAGEFCDVTLPQTICNLSFQTAGNRTLTASYAGDARFEASQVTVPHVVQVAATAITAADDTPASTVVGQPYAVSATVSSAFGPATGSIAFTDNLGANCSSALVPASPTSATAACNLPSNEPGTRTIQVSYPGNALFASAQTTIDHIVNKASTTTSIVSHLPDPNTLGVPVAVTIGLSVNAPGVGTPSGTVRVSASAGEFCDVTLPQTSCNLSFQTAGSRTLTASYAGDGRFEASQVTTPHGVQVAVTTITAADDTPANTVVGQPYAVSATVSSAFGPATGSITFTDNLGANCSSALTPASPTLATAGCNLPSNEPGTRTIQVSYPGNALFASAQTTIDHIVSKAATTAAIISDEPDPSLINTGITVVTGITVNAPGAGTPTGTVAVSASVSESCAITLPQTSCTLTLTSLGSRILTATYSGDTRFEASQSTTIHQVVGESVFQNGFE